MGLPTDVLERATAVSESLVENIKERKKRSRAYIIARRRKAVLSLKETLAQARDGKMDGPTLRSFLAQVQDEFIAQMDNLSQRDSTEGNSGQKANDTEEGMAPAERDLAFFDQ